MGELTSKFSRDDLETLLEAMGDWESLGNQEWHLAQMVRNSPMPPEDHEAYEMMQAVKEHFHRREKEIKANRETRQERAVFLKAKLMMVRRDMGIDQLFEMATRTDLVEEVASEPEVKSEVKQATPVLSGGEDFQKRLERAEYFIRDLGVWGHYEKFLSETAS